MERIDIAVDVFSEAMVVSASVAVMMLAIEYLNVRTRGALLRALGTSAWRHYALAAALGAMPGCFGAFAVVALYTDRRITLGAVSAAMIASSGDEMFVMLSLFPGTAAVMAGGLFLLGIAAGWTVDRLVTRTAPPGQPCCAGFSLHEHEHDCGPDGAGVSIAAQWRKPRGQRVALAAFIVVMGAATAVGALGHESEGIERVLLLVLLAFGLFVVVTVPDHFLQEHLWKHVALQHAPRVFLWTLGAFACVALLEHAIDVGTLLRENRWLGMGIASLVGLIPESGPHLVFVRLYSDGAIPLGILVASCAVQDGHGALPLLAHSRMDFLKVKLADLAFGLAAGGLVLLLAG